MNKRIFWVTTLFLAILCCSFVSCGGDDDDYKPTPSPTPEPVDSTMIPLIVMGDGYSAEDIKNGLFAKDVEAFKRAMVAYEPMKSLYKYFDIHTVTLTSQESGITTSKHNTALSCYMKGGGASDVFGDDNKIQTLAWAELKNTAGGQTMVNLDKTTVVVLLNTDIYGGVTLLAEATPLAQGIPNGFAITYVPVRAKLEYKDVFTELVQHEVVGHAIAKLGDEYVYTTEATDEQITKLKNGQKNGFYSNIHYHADAKDENTKYTYKVPGTNDATLYVFHHPIESTEDIYKLSTDNRINDYENLKWYRGAFEFPSKFYRPSLNKIVNGVGYVSMMDGVSAKYNMMFNAPSRLTIYKRVMRLVNGASWTFSINKTSDYEAFMTFDKPVRDGYQLPASSKAFGRNTQNIVEENDAPQLPSPRMIEINLPQNQYGNN